MHDVKEQLRLGVVAVAAAAAAAAATEHNINKHTEAQYAIFKHNMQYSCQTIILIQFCRKCKVWQACRTGFQMRYSI